MQSSIVNRPTVSSVLRNRTRKKIPDRSVCLSFIVMQACQVSCDEHQTRSFSSCFLIPYWASPVHASAVCCHAAWRVSLVCWDCKDLQNLPRSQTQVSIQHWRIFICCKHNTVYLMTRFYVLYLSSSLTRAPHRFFFFNGRVLEICAWDRSCLSAKPTISSSLFSKLHFINLCLPSWWNNILNWKETFLRSLIIIFLLSTFPVYLVKRFHTLKKKRNSKEDILQH